MRFLYVAPRYHTNQIPIMKGLKKQGNDVAFFSHYQGKIEDYSDLKPEIIGYSYIFRFFNWFYVKIIHKGNPKATDKKLLWGFPPILKLNRKIKQYNPDIVILRERSVYSIITYLVCRWHHYLCILYNQSPVYENAKEDFLHRLVRNLTPKVRMTPVMGSSMNKNHKEAGVFFVPFIMEPMLSPEKRGYCSHNKIHIFTVGKYEKRKNLLMMVEITKKLCVEYNIQVTIAGECSTECHKAYYDMLQDCIEADNLQESIKLLKNLNRKEMNEEYARADLFVLPSTAEPASISQLEAMAFSVPVICSDENGSSCYIQNGHNGYLFKDNDKGSLYKVIEKCIQNPRLIMEMGKNSYMDIIERYQFENYYYGIERCIQYLQKHVVNSKII